MSALSALRRSARLSHQTRITPLMAVERNMARVEMLCAPLFAIGRFETYLAQAKRNLSQALSDAGRFDRQPNKGERAQQGAQHQKTIVGHRRHLSALTALKVKEPRYAAR